MQQAAFGAIYRATTNLQAAQDAALVNSPSQVLVALQNVRRDLTQTDFAQAFPRHMFEVSDFLVALDRATERLAKTTAMGLDQAETSKLIQTTIIKPLQDRLTQAQINLMQ
jgi:hypothetical protein